MRMMNIAKMLLGALITVTAISMASAQDTTTSRSITSDDFASQRPAKPPVQGRAKPPSKRYTYKFVPTPKRPSRPNNVKKPVKAVPKITEIGVTMWRLRAPRSGESGHLFPVIDSQMKQQMWLAERVGPSSVFAAGDKVRFAVEASNTGYLYIFDRETYVDGSLGPPYLIFPQSSLDDNSVGPGMMVDIPDQRDDLPYFNLNPKNANYTGEMMTVIISPTRLAAFRTDGDGRLTNSDDLADLEYGSDAELFSRDDPADKIFSKVESEAACGSTARRNEQAKAEGKPCGVKTRQLTREEPFPQSIYRVKANAGQPAVVFVKLGVK